MLPKRVLVVNAIEKQVLNGLSYMNFVEQKRYRKCQPCISAEQSIQNENLIHLKS